MPMSKMLWYTDMFCTIYKPEKNTANKLRIETDLS